MARLLEQGYGFTLHGSGDLILTEFEMRYCLIGLAHPSYVEEKKNHI